MGAAPALPPQPWSRKDATVEADVTIDPDGQVTDALVTAGDSPWAEALLQALRTWRFAGNPAEGPLTFKAIARFTAEGQGRVELELTDPRRTAAAVPASEPAPAIADAGVAPPAAATPAAPAPSVPTETLSPAPAPPVATPVSPLATPPSTVPPSAPAAVPAARPHPRRSRAHRRRRLPRSRSSRQRRRRPRRRLRRRVVVARPSAASSWARASLTSSRGAGRSCRRWPGSRP